MLSKIVSMSSHASRLHGAAVSQKLKQRSSYQPSLLKTISLTVMRTLGQRNVPSHSTACYIKKHRPILTHMIEKKRDPLPKDKIQKLMSFEEYKKNHLMSFEQYKNRCARFVTDNEKGSALSKLEKAYESYTTMSYNSYREKFFPPPNPFIL